MKIKYECDQLYCTPSQTLTCIWSWSPLDGLLVLRCLFHLDPKILPKFVLEFIPELNMAAWWRQCDCSGKMCMFVWNKRIFHTRKYGTSKYGCRLTMVSLHPYLEGAATNLWKEAIDELGMTVSNRHNLSSNEYMLRKPSQRLLQYQLNQLRITPTWIQIQRQLANITSLRIRRI